MNNLLISSYNSAKLKWHKITWFWVWVSDITFSVCLSLNCLEVTQKAWEQTIIKGIKRYGWNIKMWIFEYIQQLTLKVTFLLPFHFRMRQTHLARRSETEQVARQSPASPLPPPPPASEPVVITALQTAFIISINLCWLRHGVMRRPARLSTCDSHPRWERTEGYKKKKGGRRLERGRQGWRGRELQRERAGDDYTQTHNHHPLTSTHTQTLAHTHLLTVETPCSFSVSWEYSDIFCLEAWVWR